MQFHSLDSVHPESSIIYIVDGQSDMRETLLSERQIDYLRTRIKEKKFITEFNDFGQIKFIAHLDQQVKGYKFTEQSRQNGAKALRSLNSLNITEVTISNLSQTADVGLLTAEGLALANYQFLKYKKDKEKANNSLQKINLLADAYSKTQLEELQALVEGVFFARDLINEPLSFLTAQQLGLEIQKMSVASGFAHDLHEKEWIEKEQLNGLLAVNKGSVDPPTFNVLTWKPENAVNKKPIVLVGKGVVYDTGGLSLKKTANSMDIMKCDMAAAAAVAGTFYAIAKNKLPIHVIGLVPATDNRPGLNAYVPGDVVKMHSGLTVEVMNTDAEGRMLLADALSYAQRYDPELVIDIATLTGGALSIIAQEGMIFMGNAPEEEKQALVQSGFDVHERLVELPIWDEFKDKLKSDVADIKNIGGAMGGTIIAGKFLEHFTNYPWMHIDMAPMGWLYTNSGYRLKNGSGAGVRLLYQFLKTKTANPTQKASVETETESI